MDTSILQSGGGDLAISGYLLKKSKDGIWQRRYFETNGNYLTYYKNKKMTKLLAALCLDDVGEISVVRVLFIRNYSIQLVYFSSAHNICLNPCRSVTFRTF